MDAEAISSRLHQKWASDRHNDGTYTLDLPPDNTEEFFRDVTREIKLAYQAGIIAGANASR